MIRKIIRCFFSLVLIFLDLIGLVLLLTAKQSGIPVQIPILFMGIVTYIIVLLFRKGERSSKGEINDSKNEYYIPTNSTNPKKTYDVNEDEELFLNALTEKTIESGLQNIYDLTRLSNGTINVSYGSYPVGKVKLQGRRKYLMYFVNIYDTKTIEGELKDFIDGIDYWINYIKKHLSKI